MYFCYQIVLLRLKHQEENKTRHVLQQKYVIELDKSLKLNNSATKALHHNTLTYQEMYHYDTTVGLCS